MELSFLGAINNSFRYLYKNPIIIIPTLLISIFLGIISYLFNNFYFSYNLVNLSSVYSYIWLGVFVLISILIISYLFVITIYLSGEIIMNKKYTLKQAIVSSKKVWFKNFLLMIIITLFVWGISYLSGYLFIHLARMLSLSLNQFKIILTLIYILEILGIFIFLALSNFYLVLSNSSIFDSIKKSIRKVKLIYHYVLLITVIYFAVNILISYLMLQIPNNYIYIEIINALILVPWACLILSIFTLAKKK